MKLKLLVPFLLLAIVPVGMLAWMGRRIVEAEKFELERNLEHVYLGKLRDHDASLRTVLDARRNTLLRIADSLPSDVNDTYLRRLTRKTSPVRQLFLLDERSRLIYPSAARPLSTLETEFLQRTRRIWDGKLIPPSNGMERAQSKGQEVQNDIPQRANNSSNQAYIPQLKEPQQQANTSVQSFAAGPGLEQSTDQGWLTWFWANGINVMYWTRLEDGRVIGAEFDRAALIADIISELPMTDLARDQMQDERVTLVDAGGKVVYQWGGFNPAAGEDPRASLPLSAPLSAWSLVYYPGPQAEAPELGKSSAFTMIATVVALALALLALAVFLFLEHTRAMREAATRVSFVNRVSHELKTPLTNIRMYAELLAVQMEDMDDKAMERLKVITGESERLSRLIGNVLTFSRNDRKKLILHKSSASIDSVVENVIERFEPSFDRAGIQVSKTLAAKDDVHMDSDALEQILTNLLSNVEKYAASGGVVKIETCMTEGVAMINVSDRGPGIPRKQAKRIFKPFTRLDDRVSEGTSGTGIGLGIARELARLHGGDLSLKPASEGACFVVTLNVGEN